MNKPSAPGRIAWLDIAKGLAMLAIVYGHTFCDLTGTCTSSFYQWIYSWHVPIFAVITGVIYGPRLTSLHLKKLPSRASAILTPYFTFSILYILGNLCLAGASIEWGWAALLKTVSLKGCAALWFLTAFFLAQALVSCCYTALSSLIDRVFSTCASQFLFHKKDEKRQMITLLIVGVPLLVLYLIVMGNLWGAAEILVFGRSVVLAFWLYIGVLCYRFFLWLPPHLLLIGAFGLASCYLSYKNGMRELWSVNIGSPSFYTAAVFTGSCCIIGISKLIDKYGHKRNLLYRFLTFMGAESLMVMGVHQLGLAMVEAHFDVQVVSRPLYALAQISAMVFVVGLCYLLSRRFPCIFGKKPRLQVVKSS